MAKMNSQEYKDNMSRIKKEWYKTNPSPRGSLGKTWKRTNEANNKLTTTRKARFASGKIKPYERTKAHKELMSQRTIGNKKTESHKKNLSIALKQSTKLKLENNPNWKGGISTHPYAPAFNEQLKNKIRDRDSHTCQECSLTDKKMLSIHHIDYDKKHSNQENLITLCFACNARANGKRNYWQQHFHEKILNKLEALQ